MSSRRLPEGYLELCSLDALESLVLSRMNRAANLRGDAKESLQLWVEAEADVKVAQWMLDVRRNRDLRSGYILQALPIPSSLGQPQTERLASSSVEGSRALPESDLQRSKSPGELALRSSHPETVLSIASGKRSRRSQLQRAPLSVAIVKCRSVF